MSKVASTFDRDSSWAWQWA